MTMFDPNKTYAAAVWDLSIAIVDIEADDYIRNKDGSIKLFNLPNHDYSYICDDIDVQHLHEREEGDSYE